VVLGEPLDAFEYCAARWHAVGDAGAAGMKDPLSSPHSLAPDDFIGALRRAGATSPASARPRSALPALSAESLGVLLVAGIIGEGASGAYYLRPPVERLDPAGLRSTPFTPVRVALMLAMWFIAILVPLLALIWR
jgi:hypothetical protein